MFTLLLFTVQSSWRRRSYEFSTQPGKASPFPWLLNFSHFTPEERVYFSDPKGVCATPSMGGSGARQVVSPLSRGPLGRTGFSVHLQHAFSLNPEATGTRRSHTTRPGSPCQGKPDIPSPSRSCQKGSPHTHATRASVASLSSPIPPPPGRGSTGWHTGPTWDGGNRKQAP